MKNRVYIYSVLRQPIKTILLLTVIILIAFAYMTRSTEYLLVKKETERLGKNYQAVGILQSVASNKWADTSEAITYLADRPDVDFVDSYQYTSGIIQDDFGNVDTDLQTSDMSRYLVFCGTLWDHGDTYFHFIVDSVLAGSPEYVYEGLSVVLHCQESQKISDTQLINGGHYLAVGYYSLFPPSYIEYDQLGRMTGTHALLSCPLKDGVFYCLSEGQKIDWTDSKLKELSAFIHAIRDEQHSLNVITTKDMSSLPFIQGTPQIYLVDGRWLDYQDYAETVKSCVIHKSLASAYGLALGDKITLKLRDIPSFFGYCKPFPMWRYSRPSNFLRPLKIESDGTFTAGDPISDTKYQHTDFSSADDVQTHTDTFEIAGIYEYTDQYQRTAVRNFVYIPASSVPESFSMTTAETLGAQGVKLFSLLEEETYLSATLPSPGSVSFVLKSPDIGKSFLYEVRDILAPLGFQVSLLDNGWDAFQASAAPMRKSSLLNVSVFVVLLMVVFCLVAVIYYSIRRKEIGIARALGVPVNNCVWDVSLPLLSIGVLGIGIGGLLGWRYTLNNVGSILQALNEFSDGKVTDLSALWLAALLIGAFVSFAVIALGGAYALSRRSILTLIHGDAQTARNKRSEPVQATVFTVQSAQPVSAAVSVYRVERTSDTQNSGTIHTLGFVLQHITRSRLKSGLSILLAAGFTVSLAAIQLSIADSQERMDWLYENTSVEAELLLADAAQEIPGGGFLRQDTIYALMDSGYVTDAYLEGSANGVVFRYIPGMEDSRGIYASKENMVKKTILAFADEERFLSSVGSGGAVTITYFDDWDGSLFAEDWTADKFPVVLPKAVYEEFGGKVGLSCKGSRVCEAAGYYEGEAAAASRETDPVLIPLSAYQAIGNGRAANYSKAHVALDPSLNRELETFTQIVNDLSTSQGLGAIALRAVIWDEELRLTVAPLENSVELMEVLYPVTLALSLLVAVGIAILFVMTSAKEAAIMRVLGTTLFRSRAMLSLQNILTSLAGLLLGFMGVLLYTGRSRPELLATLAGASVLCAVLYLLAAVAGAVVSAIVVTGRNPLELLQVKE